MIKIYHEAPKAIFKKMQEKTDGDYALVHLFEEDEEYYKLFDPTKRDVILDNSIFELGTAFDSSRFAQWIEKLEPTWYIVPDVLEDGQATVKQFMEFVDAYPDLPGKRIGVAQGKDFDDLIKCYEAIEPHCDKVALSFDFSWWHKEGSRNKWKDMMIGRNSTLLALEVMGVINKEKPHHLLGTALPQEIQFYAEQQRHGNMLWIDSIDTSNPVIHGIKGIIYKDFGLETKESQKLFELINYVPTEEEEDNIWFNVDKYRRFSR